MTHDEEAPLIYRMGLPAAERAGLILSTGTVGDIKVYVSRRLLETGFAEKKIRVDMIRRGLEMLNRPDPADDSYLQIRYVDVYDAWAIRTSEGIAYRTTETYKAIE